MAGTLTIEPSEAEECSTESAAIEAAIHDVRLLTLIHPRSSNELEELQESVTRSAAIREADSGDKDKEIQDAGSSLSTANGKNLKILGAAYGLANVTTTARGCVQNGVFDAIASDAIFGDSWPGKPKTLVVVYEYKGVPSMLSVVKEKQKMYFAVSPPLCILGATYGPADRTDEVVSLVKDAALNVVASNATFGNTWKEKTKTLVVMYRYGNEKPAVKIAKQNERLSIAYDPPGGASTYLPPTDPATLNVLGAVYGLGDVTMQVQSLVSGNKLNFIANNKTFGNTWPDKAKTFTLVYQYGRDAPVMKRVKQNKRVTVQKVVPSPFTGQIKIKDLLETEDVITLSASNNKFMQCDSKGKLIAVEDSPDSAAKFEVRQNKDDTVSFQVAGKYVVLNSDQFLYATGSLSEAAKFEVSLSAGTSAGIRLASSTTNEYARLYSDGESIRVDAVNNFSLSTYFGIALRYTPEATVLQRRGLRPLSEANLSDCEKAQLQFIWKITGGFFLAIGLGPFILTGKPSAGLIALIKTNERAKEAIEALGAAVQTARGAAATATSLLGVIGVLYQEGLLWTIFKMSLLKEAGWYTAAWALAKIIQVVLVPETEVAELLANFAVWSAQTVEAGLDVATACN